MLASIRVFWDILLIRRGPRDAPASGASLCLLGALYLLSSVLVARADVGSEQAFVIGLVDLAVTTTVFALVLAIRGRDHRVVQTLCAVFGTGILFSIPNLALVELFKATSSGDAVRGLLSLGYYALLAWQVFVMGHILRSAIDVQLWTGVTIAMSYAIVSILIAQYWAPPVAT